MLRRDRYLLTLSIPLIEILVVLARWFSSLSVLCFYRLVRLQSLVSSR